MPGDVFMQAAALRAEDDGGGTGEIHFVVFFGTALVQAVDPVAAFFQFLQRAIDVADAHNGEVGERSGGGADNDFGETGGAALRNHDGRGAGGVCGADDRAEIVRILDTVENHVQTAAGDSLLECGVFGGGTDPDDALMRDAARGAIEMVARFEADGDAALAAQVDQFLDAGAGCTLYNEDAIERTARPDRLPDGMDSRERRHYDKGTLMSAHENIPMQPAFEIPDKLYFRIGEVARLAGIKPYVLRFWETEFPPLGPKKSGTGHRLYRRKDVELVLEIKRLLYEKRFTIEGARKFLETRGKTEAAAPRPAKAAKPPRVQQELFSDPNAALIDTVRNELRALAEMLK